MLKHLGLFVFIAILSSPAHALILRPIGTVKVTKSNYSCNSAKDFCYDLTITCPSVPTALKATVSTRKPPIGAPELGTISFHSGAGGTTSWSNVSSYADAAVTELNAMGYRIAQVKWASDWFQGSATGAEGISLLACRPATVLNWINTNFKAPGTPLCATGNSGGGIQVAYSMVDYGLSTILNSAVITSAPGLSQIDNGCFDNSTSPLYLVGQTSIVDKSYGYKGNRGPCTLKTVSYTSRFVSDSIAESDRAYFYPTTNIAMYLGALDTATATVAQSQLFFDKLVQAGTPSAAMEILPNSPHELHSLQEGVDKIKTSLINGCVPHS